MFAEKQLDETLRQLIKVPSILNINLSLDIEAKIEIITSAIGPLLESVQKLENEN